MSSKTKIVLRKKANKEGLFPLAIRITKNRRSSYMFIGHYIDQKYWDEKRMNIRKSHPNSELLNTLLSSKLAEVNKTLMELQFENNDVSSFRIKKELSASNSDKSFSSVSDEYLNELESNNKLTRLNADKVRVNHVLKFYESKHLMFQEIDEGFLVKFQTYLRRNKKLSERSIVNNLVVIRTLYNRAIKMGIVDQKAYPFGAGKIQIRFPETEKIGLTIVEIKIIESLQNLTKMEEHTRNVWLFSFYLAGIRVADVLKIRWSDLYDGRIHYRMNKNAKLVSLKLPDKIIPILEYYEPDRINSNDFIFPELKRSNFRDPKDVYAKTNTATSKFNKHLRGIADKAGLDKKLTMHIARHSFGNIAGDRIPVQMLQKLYRHTTITTTMQYQANFISKETDKALEEVVNF
ncbi:site-specific integrase [Arenibacter sp. S6351L]|uniref:site-specific integrase n=1 Tax=Arenibacter sp. S6351L TaxID=2926407 RepID=UPI001FF2EAB7|nr:site-specific integrase [Arenibacter sp. S6351L]MCK0136053.1 site-specific integrase [Arenibacter sp. S6351L]